MILSRQIWVDACNRFDDTTGRPTPVTNYRPTPFGPECIAITGYQQDYMDFISCLVWVQYATTPILALQEMRSLIEATRIWPAPHTNDPEVAVWYIPSVRVQKEEAA